jgi:hypothetical protein
VWLVNSGPNTPFLTDSGTASWNPWPLITPDQHDGFSTDQYIEGTCNVLGEADSLRYSKNINNKLIVMGKPDWPELHAAFLTYIGAINGE